MSERKPTEGSSLISYTRKLKVTFLKGATGLIKLLENQCQKNVVLVCHFPDFIDVLLEFCLVSGK